MDCRGERLKPSEPVSVIQVRDDEAPGRGRAGVVRVRWGKVGETQWKENRLRLLWEKKGER